MGMSREHLLDELRRLKPGATARWRESDLCAVVERNIAALAEVRHRKERTRDRQDRVADWMTGFSGSMTFVYLHVVWFGVWIAVNLGWLGERWRFDPYPFGLLTLIVSLEAIFLSTFVLLSENRQADVADQRADLDLQINLLTEHEVTRILTLVDAIADHLGLEAGKDPELEELKKDINPEQVLSVISQQVGNTSPEDARRALPT